MIHDKSYISGTSRFLYFPELLYFKHLMTNYVSLLAGGLISGGVGVVSFQGVNVSYYYLGIYLKMSVPWGPLGHMTYQTLLVPYH